MACLQRFITNAATAVGVALARREKLQHGALVFIRCSSRVVPGLICAKNAHKS